MTVTTLALLELLGLLVIIWVIVWLVWTFERQIVVKPPPTEQSTKVCQNSPEQRVWVIYNPLKAQKFPDFFDQMDSACQQLLGHKPHWVTTSVEDPGTRQAVKALRSQPRLVIAAGGDGTVRAVAAGMAHSSVPMGIIPLGTGNLFARNLGLPMNIPLAIKRVLTGSTIRADLAWLRLDNVEQASNLPPEGALLLDALDEIEQAQRAKVARQTNGFLPLHCEFAYLVVAGVGFDGKTMQATDPKLKRRVGWSAYVITSLKYLLNVRMQARLTIFDPVNQEVEPTWLGWKNSRLKQTVLASQTIGADSSVLPADKRTKQHEITNLHAQTILFANCGSLPFARLAPDAAIDDGLLDIIAVDTQAGLLGWADLAVKVLFQGVGVRAINFKRSLSQIAFRQSPRATVDLRRPETVEVDGDPIGSARTISVRADAGALLLQL